MKATEEDEIADCPADDHDPTPGCGRLPITNTLHAYKPHTRQAGDREWPSERPGKVLDQKQIGPGTDELPGVIRHASRRIAPLNTQGIQPAGSIKQIVGCADDTGDDS